MIGSRPDVRLFRNMVGVARCDDGSMVRFGLCNGSSDLIGICRGGRFLAIECKRPGERPTHDQALFLQMVRDMGGIGVVATCVEDVVEALAVGDVQ